MPTNLPPEYFEVERRYRAAKSVEHKIALLEELISTVPKHKGTEKLRAGLRRRLSKLRASAETRKGASQQVSAFHIEREGAGQVVVVGPTNVGKSALVAALTNATPEVAEYPYTTWTPTPGMMEVGGVQIQLIDTPPLDRGYIEPELLNLIRRSNLVLLVVDLQAYPIEELEDTIAILEEHRIVPQPLQDRARDQQRMTVVPLVVVVNKNDDEDTDGDFAAFRELMGDEWPLLPVSAATGRNLDRLRWEVFQRLEIIRVYAKPPGKEPDLSAPFVLKKGSTVEEFAGKVHQDFLEQLKAARVWGSGVYDGQMVGRSYVLHDGDVVELRT
ncbi:MAG TPA: TGS domain-containing protein [Anaerolineales bacterium]|nr:TGS domain-containing protein [Anaerolineae bacterium]HIQ00550.1 TGS domain-containing protein [Anaerolineales bacterium]